MKRPSLWRNQALFATKVFRKLQRVLVEVPPGPMVKIIESRVHFEHILLPFLDPDDYAAMVTNSYDIILCDFLKRHLKPGDIVLDAGANVGYISAVAASYVQPSGEVHGFEPLPECFARLERLRELNPAIHFRFNNVALGEANGSLPISYNPDKDSRNATMVPGENSVAVRNVPVQRLDEYIKANIASPERISLIKIDVEGFEYSLLRGLRNFFAETSCRPIIVCEVKPWQVAKLGGTLQDFDRYMGSFGYSAFLIARPTAPVLLAELTDMDVVVFRA